MPFNSYAYLVFLPAVFAGFYLCGERWRWCVLLLSSIAFYAALKVPYLLAVLALVVVTTYFFGRWIEVAASAKVKLALLWGGIVVNASVLIFLKYLPSAYLAVKAVAPQAVPDGHALSAGWVTIGVSYYVFQAISYLTDVYMELQTAERHAGYFALYLTFFPKLLQGPIERAEDLIPQLQRPYRFNYHSLRSALLLLLWGFFKKVCVADRLGLYVDAVYNDVHAYGGVTVLLATYAYALQIYMDFSGYTDMARGSARLFGIELSQNFNAPYAATSVAEFWRRWHMTFSRWILDYIFKPLQMQWRSLKTTGTAAALMVAFLVSGVWHGATWGFLAWGALHGLYLASSVFYRPYQKKLHKVLGVEKTGILRVWQVFATFNLVCFAWIFFRARSIGDSIYLISSMVTGGTKGLQKFLLLQDRTGLALAVCLVAAVMVAEGRSTKSVFSDFFHSKPLWMRWSFYYLLIFSTMIFSVEGGTSFAYFQF